MKNIFILFFLIIFSVNAEEIKIIAKVNNEIITSKDLDDFCKMLTYRLEENSALSTTDENFRKEALERLIEDKLILEFAKKQNLQIPSSLIDEKINQIILNFPSQEEFEEFLIEKGLNITGLRKRIEEQILVKAILTQYVHTYISISPQEINDFYNQNRDIFVSPAKYIILIANAQDKDDLIAIGKYIKMEGLEKAKIKYTDILTELEGSEDTLRREILKIVQKLSTDEFTIKKIDNRYYLIYLEKIIPSQQLSFDEAKENVRTYLYNLKFKERFHQWVSQLKKKASIKIYE
ncbi:MAG: SurA N-terminal domain-containing protein [Candidatus Omnitrophica bacterium]|nr:SurA N-terminal domain-containing protein [Candidatus Omnitrophota bacterium]